MATALVLFDDGRRVNGRWKRGSVSNDRSVNSVVWSQRLKECGTILDHRPDLAADVANGRWKRGSVDIYESVNSGARYFGIPK